MTDADPATTHDPLRAARARDRRRVCALAALVALLGAAGVAGFRSFARETRENTANYLQGVARARSATLAMQLDERRADAWLLARHEEVRRVLRPGNTPAAQAVAVAELRAVMRDAARAYGYRDAQVLDAAGRPVMALEDDRLEANVRAVAGVVARTRHTTLVRVHAAAAGVLEFGVVAPVFATAEGVGPVIGMVCLSLDARQKLLPLLDGQGIRARSFEAMLLQQDGANAVVVGASRMSPERAPLTERVPMPSMERAHRASGARVEHPVEGLDYRGVEVVGGAAHVPDSPWIVVAKIDQSEVERPLRVAAVATAGIIFGLLAMVGLIARLLWLRRHQEIARRQVAEAERATQIVQTSLDGYLLYDEGGTILDANAALLAISGYTREELIGRALWDFDVARTEREIVEAIAGTVAEGGGRFTTRWRHKDRSIVDLDVRASVLREGDAPRIVAFSRDITHQLKTQRRLERYNRLYAFLNQTSERLFQARTRDEAFEVVARIAVEQGGFRRCWVAMVDEAAGLLRPIALGGAPDGDSLAPTPLIAGGPVGRSIREVAPVVIDGFTTHEETANWHERGRALGLEAMVSLPVVVDGKVVAVVVFFAEAPGFFEPEVVGMLGQTSRFLGVVAQSVTAEERRRREEERRRESERRLEELFESSPVAMHVMHEPTGRVTRVNHAFTELFGYALDDVATLDAQMRRFFPDPAYRAELEAMFAGKTLALEQGQRLQSPDLRVRCADGSERALQGSVSRVDDEVMVAWIDLTELRANQSLLSEAQRIAKLCSWAYDFRTGVMRRSEDFYRVLGLEEPEAPDPLRVPPFALLVPDDRDAAAEAFLRAIAERSPYDQTSRAIDRGGRPKYIRGRATIQYDAAGEPVQAVGSSQDVTAEVLAAEELVRYRDHLEELVGERTAALAEANEALRSAKVQAEEASRAKSAFLAVMSHEIRTPMNGVLGMAEVLAQSELRARDAEAVRTIRASATSLLGLLDDILDFSKIEAGRLELEHVDTSLEQTLEDVRDALMPVARARGVRLSTFLAPDVPRRIVTDATRVRQILLNLVGNAIKFSSSDPLRPGRVRVRVEVASADPLRLRYTVVDNGIGISDEDQRRLFTSFRQAESSTTRRFGGTGLGLAICRRLAELLGGDIDVRSAPGEGATFWLTLPTVAAEHQPPRLLPDVAGLECVVVVDPQEPDDAAEMGAYLRHAGARVTTVVSAEEGRREATARPPPVVLLDRSDEARGGAVFDDDRVRHLRITEGDRHIASVVAPNLVVLDRSYMREGSLLRAVAVAVGRASPEVFYQEAQEPVVEPGTTPLTAAQAREQGRLILVAEDDEINQRVILRQLELLGYAAEVAVNGAEALRLWRGNQYALLLSDLHMPEMDGYTLARSIRREESPGEHLPIVALTANALRGEELRARQCGMDEYLTKPVQLRRLKETLTRWVGRPGSSADDLEATGQSLPAAPVEAPATLDVKALEALVGSEPEVIRTFLSEFRAAAQRDAEALRGALSAGDLTAVGRVAHRLKSSSRSVGALALADQCARLEAAAKRHALDEVTASMRPFELSVTQVVRALSEQL
ncbi:MAG: PAS domain S-box protein [Polyangiales bacterium]